MSKLKYYYDLLSQPSRALWIACQLSKTPYEACPLDIRRREQRTEQYKQINRFQKVPCIVDGDFKLSESVAIIRYLTDKGLFSERLYPRDLQARARVDEFLAWQHLNVRLHCDQYYMWVLRFNRLAKKPSDNQRVQLLEAMENCLTVIERIWLHKTKYLTGDELRVADLFGTAEILQTKIINYTVDSKKFPKIDAWLERVRAESNPYFDEAHKIVYERAASESNLSKI